MSSGNGMSSKHDCGGDVAAYLLGALEPAEADAFTSHLMSCAVCREELEALRGVADVLPMAVQQYRAPKRLRRNVRRAVRQDARRARSAPRSGWMTKRWQPRSVVAATACAAVIVAGAITGLELSGSGTRVIQAHVVGIGGTADVSVTSGKAELVVRQLTPPPAGHVYEVWLEAPGKAPSPANVLFSVTARGTAQVRIPRSVRGIAQLMVTPEPDGGSPAPTHSPVIVAQLT